MEHSDKKSYLSVSDTKLGTENAFMKEAKGIIGVQDKKNVRR